VNRNVKLRSPRFYPQSKQLCVILHYYTHTNAGRESNTAGLHIEYGDGRASTVVGYLEPSEVSFILDTHFYLIYLGRENNFKKTAGFTGPAVGKLCKRKNDRVETLENMDIDLLKCLILRTLAVWFFKHQ